ncbi:hypothetical protein I350_01778 [Cryptococcus amylolentus CBS 6273]|uniref:Integral membrane bound transporter domain-containing protein n=1 Tax=Cryptococcus amylolentus CBS 6273 TaxID=1296118 RepID=A0A1E3KDJ1_9TREE|nr:hypothetical protein I350_01778 [Cryptococcus amylolentus CBS 6273]
MDGESVPESTSQPIQTPYATPRRSQPSSTGTVRRAPSSYFSLPYSYASPAGPSNWRNRIQDGGQSFRQRAALGSPVLRGSLAGSVRSGGRADDLDNWQSLHEMVTEDDDEDEGPLSTLRTPGGRSMRSYFTTSSPQTATRPVTAASDRQDGQLISNQLSSSPGILEGRLHSNPFDTASGETTPRTEGITFLRSPTRLEEATEPLLSGHDPMSASKFSIKSTKSAALPQLTCREKYWPPPIWVTNVLKCSLAYLIASLFTFVPQLAALLSTASETDAHGRVTAKPAYSAHMVATIVVYFNPAKSLGNMLLSTRYCFLLAILSTLISLLATLTIHIFDHYSPSHGESWDWISEAGDWVVCILWIGGTMGALAWSKLWVGNPAFNSGCSMAAMILYNVVIKEGAFPKLIEILLIVFTGVCITNIICFTIFPVSATSNLQSSISKSLTSFSTLLDLLTSTFLLERSTTLQTKTNTKTNTTRPKLQDAIKAHSAAFKTLEKDLAEAKFERVVDGRVRGRKLELYDAAIGSMGRLAQHLSSLRSSTRLQEGLIRASREGRVNLDFGHERGHSKISMSDLRRDMNGDGEGEGEGREVPGGEDIAGSVHLFMVFREMAGAQMDALNDQCDKALEAVQALARVDQTPQINLSAIRADLVKALNDFSRYSSKAIKRIYAGPRREREVWEKSSSSGSEESTGSSEGDDWGSGEGEGEDNHAREGGGGCGKGEKKRLLVEGQEHLDDGPNETIFWIYYFLFTFEEFAREMVFLVDTMEEIVTADRVSAWDHIRSVIAMKRGRKKGRGKYLYKQLQNIVPIDPSRLQPPLYPKNGRDSAGPIVVPSMTSLSWLGKVKQMSWAVGERLSQPDAKYAIKTGMGGAMLAAPAFTEFGRPIFLRYRGEWALIAYFATINQTIGQTNFMSMARIAGTAVGAGVAVIFTLLFPDNNIALAILGFLFSIPCFYVITQMPDYMNAGRFVLLTYNLTCLYTYNTRDRGDTLVESVAFRRATSVIVGVLWAAIVSRYWWPFTARRELRVGLSDFCLDLSYLYSKLVTTYSKGVDHGPIDTEDADIPRDEEEPLLPPGTIGHPHLSPGVRQFMAMELHLQSQLSSLKSLLAHTKNEPRLKGPFAFDFYKEVLLSCERMLDRLHSMRCVTTRDEWDNGIRDAFVVPVNKERREMAGNVILYFYTLSAGFRLRTPVPPYLPPAEHARQRLVTAIRSLDVVKRRSVRGGGRHLLFFAYALAMQEVIAELEGLGAMMQEAFGVISHSSTDDFEELFAYTPEAMLKRHRELTSNDQL